jgi:hypothetical protein
MAHLRIKVLQNLSTGRRDLTMLGKIFPGDMRWGHYYPDFHFHTRVIRRAATTVGTGGASKISSKTNTSSVGSSVSLRRQSSLNSEREGVLYKRLSTLSEPDLDLLYGISEERAVITSLAAEAGISSGTWIRICDQYDEFYRLDFHLYWLAIEPQIEAWVDSVERARKKLSSLSKGYLR